LTFYFLVDSDLELKPTGVLEVKLVQAKELTNKDLIGKSDPFAVLYVRPLRDRMKKSKIIVSYSWKSFFNSFDQVKIKVTIFLSEQRFEPNME